MSEMTGWLQREVSFAEDPLELQEKLYALSVASAAGGNQVNRDLALLSRTNKQNRQVWLLSPVAAKHAHLLPGQWVPAHDITAHGWSLLYSSGVTHEELGLRSTYEVRS